MPSPYDIRYRHRSTPEELLSIAQEAGISFADIRSRLAVKFRPDPDNPGWVHGWLEVAKMVASNGVGPVRLEEFSPAHHGDDVPDHACTYTMAVFLATGTMVAMMSAEELRACVDSQHMQPAHALRGAQRVLPSVFTHW